MIQHPSNGSQITAVENVTKNNNSGSNNDTSIITYDHIGNPLWLGHSGIKYITSKVSVACKHYGCILNLDVFHIITGPRRFIERTSRKKEKIHWGVCLTYMDNHADTHYFWRNIRLISFTSKECIVAPFLVDSSEQVNMPICTVATSYTMESGEVIILIFGQGLWFGNRMGKTLINPNHCQDFGIPICDESNDQHRPLEIEIDFNTHIPMSVVISTCGFIT